MSSLLFVFAEKRQEVALFLKRFLLNVSFHAPPPRRRSRLQLLTIVCHPPLSTQQAACLGTRQFVHEPILGIRMIVFDFYGVMLRQHKPGASLTTGYFSTIWFLHAEEAFYDLCVLRSRHTHGGGEHPRRRYNRAHPEICPEIPSTPRTAQRLRKTTATSGG
jgi:hypothetical protein